jgi:hypothetical protein
MERQYDFQQLQLQDHVTKVHNLLQQGPSSVETDDLAYLRLTDDQLDRLDISDDRKERIRRIRENDRLRQHALSGNLPDQYSQYENIGSNPLDFYTGNGEFNLALFNQVFRDQQKSKTSFYEELEKKRLSRLSQIKYEKKLHEYTIGDHLFRIKNAFLGTIEDLQKEELPSNIFTKDNRLFYLGIMLVIFVLIYLIIHYLAKEE